nr:hypothetical protein [Tanacetum cinerariifolium]
MENTMLELVEVCRQKEFYCMNDNVDDLIESALNSKLLSINLKSQRHDKKKQEVKNIVEQPTKCGTRIAKSLQSERLIVMSEDNFSFVNVNECVGVNMASLTDKAILSGAENHPPMLEKDMYDSWRSRMELYVRNKQHSRMILESVEHGPLLWPSVTEDGVT